MDQMLRNMELAHSVQRNVPYGSGLDWKKSLPKPQMGGNILRSGDAIRSSTPAIGRGGFAIPPALIAAGVPIIADILKRPVNKFFDWLGLGNGGALYREGGGALMRSGGFWQQAGDLGMSVAPAHNPQHAAMGQIGSGGALSNREIKNMKVLEKKLGHLTQDPQAFMAKLLKIQAAGEGYLKKNRKAMKSAKTGAVGGVKKYKKSKRYFILKRKHYGKYPKSTYGKYFKSEKYMKHKGKYIDHQIKKKKA